MKLISELRIVSTYKSNWLYWLYYYYWYKLSKYALGLILEDISYSLDFSFDSTKNQVKKLLLISLANSICIDSKDSFYTFVFDFEREFDNINFPYFDISYYKLNRVHKNKLNFIHNWLIYQLELKIQCLK